jgi:hypothetical protein
MDMRKSTFASIAALALTFSLALTGCQVGDEGDGGGGGGGDPKPDAGGGGGGTPDAGAAQACPPSEAEFKTQVFDVAMAPYGCATAGCHGGGAGGFTLSEANMGANLTAASNKAKKLDGAKAILVTKPTGQSANGHGGGKKYEANSTEAQALEKFIGQVNGAAGACPP